MRNLLLSSLALFLSLSAIAQPPAAFQYQAVARDNAGDPLANSNVGVMMSILQNSATGTVAYSETHVVVTNELGLFTLMVGMGSAVSGDFSVIDWGAGPYFLKVDLDPSGGTSFTHVGTTQLLSVPYALHAGTVSDKDDADADPTNEIQSLSVAQTTSLVDLGISGSDTVRFFIEDDDPDPTNEIQSLAVAQTTSLVDLAISGSDTVRFFIEDDDPDPTNELQTISVAQTTALVDLMISGTNDTVRFFIGDDDPDPTNELQEMSITAILDGSVIGLTEYQLNLTGVDPITLPIEDYWNADFFLSDPPQVATVWSQFPVRVPNFEVENEATITTLTSQDLTVGSSTDGAVHIQADNIHFDGPLELPPGWFLNRESLVLAGRSGGTDFDRIELDGTGLDAFNNARWQTVQLDFENSGALFLNQASGLRQFQVTTGTA
ncbi:MAG: hypothetical protein R3330_12315, partial [Saprospiraceae bacterium]|nr:hypothetical protein [Saprospiraceae bacterium]